MVKLSPIKTKKITDELSQLHSGRCSFTVGQAAKLLGNLEYAATVAPWVRLMGYVNGIEKK